MLQCNKRQYGVNYICSSPVIRHNILLSRHVTYIAQLSFLAIVLFKSMHLICHELNKKIIQTFYYKTNMKLKPKQETSYKMIQLENA